MADYDAEYGTGTILVKDKKLSGRAAQTYLEGQAKRVEEQRRTAAERAVAAALVEACGWERILSVVARNAGEDVAHDAARLLGLNSEMWARDRQARVRSVSSTVKQASVVNPSVDFANDPTHAPEVVAAILRGAGQAEINREIDNARQRLEQEQSGQRSIGPDSPPEETQPAAKNAASHSRAVQRRL